MLIGQSVAKKGASTRSSCPLCFTQDVTKHAGHMGAFHKLCPTEARRRPNSGASMPGSICGPHLQASAVAQTFPVRVRTRRFILHAVAAFAASRRRLALGGSGC